MRKLDKFSKTIFVVAALLSYSNAFSGETLWIDNWAIMEHDVASANPNLTLISALGFAQDGKTKLSYVCSYDKKENFKRSAISIILKEEISASDGTAAISFNTDKDSGEFVATEVNGAEISINNLYFWDLLKNSKTITLSIEIRDAILKGKIVYVNNNLSFDLKGLKEVKAYTDKKCNFKN